MSHKKKYPSAKTANRAETPLTGKPQSTKTSGKPYNPYLLPALFFLLFLAFCTFFYGDVFCRAQQEAFVCADADAMNYMLRQPLGHLAWAGRWMLVVYKSVWLGGLVMAALLSLIAYLVDRIFRLAAKWKGLAYVPSLLILAYFVCLGLNVFYQSEPAWIMLIPVLSTLVLLVIWALQKFIPQKQTAAGAEQSAPATCATLKCYGTFAALLLAALLYAFAFTYGENTVVASRQQLAYQNQDWDALIEQAMKAKRPTRVVAGYNAIGALRTNQIFDQIFAIPYDYPNAHLKSGKTADEYKLFQADCDLETGLVQAAYHYYLEYNVLYGPSTYNLKNLAICAVLQGQRQLAEKYFTVLSKVPFETDFIERYKPMLDNPSLIDKDEHLAAIKELTPREDKFEQQYRQPAFLGYNLGLLSGPDKVIYTSIAAILYSKDLALLMPRLQVMKQKGMPISGILLQAVCCLSIKNPDVLKEFPDANMEMSNFQQFLMESKPYVKDKDALRKEMKNDWLGTYYYYYYAENNSPEQTGQASSDGGGVN